MMTVINIIVRFITHHDLTFVRRQRVCVHIWDYSESVVQTYRQLLATLVHTLQVVSLMRP